MLKPPQEDTFSRHVYHIESTRLNMSFCFQCGEFVEALERYTMKLRIDLAEQIS